MAKATAANKAPTAKSPGGFAPTRAPSAASKGQKLPNFAVGNGGDRTKGFRLAAHRSSWELTKVGDEWHLLPTLKPMVLQAGVNWTPAAGRGQTLSSVHLESRAREQWDFVVLTDIDEYIVEVEGAEKPGIFTRWERVKVYADGRWSISMDRAGYNEWRASLVSEGRIEGPRDDVLADLRARLVRAQNRATRTPHLADAQRAGAEAAERLAGLDSVVAAMEGAA